MLLGGLLPPPVVVVERFGDEDEAVLFPEEEAAVARAVGERRREFATVRQCARDALAALGRSPAPIVPLAGEGPPWARRAPRWPEGAVGSLTHCEGYRAAAVARAGDVRSVGVDAEPNVPLPDGVLRLVASEAERAALDRLRAVSRDVEWGRVLFSAKESVYKAWFPLAGEWLGFRQCALDIAADGTFVASVVAPGPVDTFTGRWRASAGYVATAVTVLR